MKNGTPPAELRDLRETALRFIEPIIEVIEDPVALADEDGRIFLVNARWAADPPTRSSDIRTAAEDIALSGTGQVDAAELKRFVRSLDAVLAGSRDSCELGPGQSFLGARQPLIRATRLATAPATTMLVIGSGADGRFRLQAQENAAEELSSAEFGIDPTGNILDWNSGAEALFGQSEDEVSGTHISALFARSADPFPGEEMVERLSEQRQPLSIDLRLKKGTGEFFDGVLSLSPADTTGETRIACRVDVVSDRQRAAGALRRSEERLRYALEAASDGLWDWDLRSDEVISSARVAEIFGEDAVSDGVRPASRGNLESRLHPEDRTEWHRLLHAHFEGKTPTLESEHRIRTDRDEWKWVLLRGRVTERDRGGKPLRMLGTITDISERKLAQEALKRSEGQYRNLFEYASDAVILFDPDSGEVRDANEKAQHLLGYSGTALRTMAIRELHPDDQWDRLAEALDRSKSGESSLFEVDGLTSDGKRIPLETTTRLVAYGDGYVYQSFMRDVSQRHMLERQLRQSQKMETVGRLAGGIAHDFNNLLTAIQGYTTLLQSALPEGSGEREMTEEVIHAVTRATRLTSQLLTFSRYEVSNLVPLDLNTVVRDMEKLLRRLIGEHVTMETSLESDPSFIEADRGRIEQVVTNLVINAADAIPKGGTIRIRSDNIRVGPGQPDQPMTLPNGDYVLLSVQDNGYGMDPETLSRVFEPFFTTKDTGNGTGLGLATVYGIVKQSEGHIHVESTPGGGSTFRVYLPLRTAPETEPLIDTVHASRTGQETVLIVEDEPAVRRLTRRFLETSGYNVVEAGSPADAIRMAESQTAAIDLLLTDVIMPELSGPALADRLRGLLPSLKVLYMSGYPGDYIARHGISGPEITYLQKPFSQEDLQGKMREVLDA